MESLKQLVYLSDEDGFYGRLNNRATTLVDFTDFRYKGLNFLRFKNGDLSLDYSKPDMYYAYGVMVNPLKSNIIPLDFDNISFADIRHITESFLDNFSNSTEQIDILQSTAPNKFHVYIGLNDTYRIENMISSFPRLCSGFKSFCRHNNQLVLRVSQKFFRTKESTASVPLYTLRKRSDALFESTNNILFPISSVTKNTEKECKKPSLNLRK